MEEKPNQDTWGGEASAVNQAFGVMLLTPSTVCVPAANACLWAARLACAGNNSSLAVCPAKRAGMRHFAFRTSEGGFQKATRYLEGARYSFHLSASVVHFPLPASATPSRLPCNSQTGLARSLMHTPRLFEELLYGFYCRCLLPGCRIKHRVEDHDLQLSVYFTDPLNG